MDGWIDGWVVRWVGEWMMNGWVHDGWVSGMGEGKTNMLDTERGMYARTCV